MQEKGGNGNLLYSVKCYRLATLVFLGFGFIFAYRINLL